MDYVAVVALLALLQYAAFGMAVGHARGKYGVKAPAVAGHEVFERYFRVQQNTLELIVVLLPSLWLFAQYVDANWAAVLGVVYLAGRTVYFIGYVRDPARRELGFALTALPIVALLVGALVGVVVRSVGA
ncbi:MAG TPA: MAPEG family protein [Steroidobacteraceae bacterium]|nr:MAPEG family protein [Steroidobacteraceae bacterium]